MKRIFKLISIALIVAICFGLSSCSLFPKRYERFAVTTAHKKLEVKHTDSEDEGYKNFLKSLELFSAELSAALYNSCGNSKAEDNLSFSPLSIYMALALSAECADGETREEILSALGMSYEEIERYTKFLYAFVNQSFTVRSGLSPKDKTSAFCELNNSIWIDDSISINKETAENLSKSYHADVFSSSFKKGKAQKAIASYIEDKTRGLIDGDIDFSKETLCVLLNTLYLKEIWNTYGDKLHKTYESYSFRNTDGTQTDLKLLRGENQPGRAFDGEDYTSFYTRTEHGYKLHFILPDEDKSVGEVFNGANIAEILSITDYGAVDNENMQNHYTRILFPEFEASFDRDISSVLREDFGIEKLFSSSEAELSSIKTDNGDKLYCSTVIHRTALEVNERGIEGAAITAVAMDGSAGPPYEAVYHDFVIDRAFGFLLTDSYGTVLFSGVVNSLD